MNPTEKRNGRCSICNVETSQPDLLRAERRSFRKSFLYYCPDCWGKLETERRRDRLKWWLANIVLGLGLISLFPASPFGWLLINLAWFEACLALSIVPHEFAHAFTARALGHRVFRVIIGSGSTFWRGTIFGFDTEAKIAPFDGAVAVAPRETQGIRWKRFFHILAGPMANVVLLAIALVAHHPHSWSLESCTERWVAWPIFAWTNLLVVITNLWPHQIQTALGVLPSDGRQLFDALFGREKKTAEERHATWFAYEALTCAEQQRPAEERSWLEKGLALYPENFQLRDLFSVSLMNAGELEAARRILLTLLAETPAPNKKRFVLTNNIAYVDALLDDAQLLEEADHYSAEALASAPWHPSLKNTRGVVLLALNRLDEALPLLRTSANAGGKIPRNSAQCYCSLAIGEARQGQLAAAERALETARLAAPDCFLIPRAEAAVQSAREKLRAAASSMKVNRD